MSKLDIALDLIRRGLFVFPLHSGQKTPATVHGFKAASKEDRVILNWWSKNPMFNIGIATGLSGLVVVDIDVKKQAEGKKSIAWIKGLIPKTYTVRTPSGGWHLYFSTAAPVRSRNGFLPGVDVKSDGGYVVAEGSEIDGKKYMVTQNIPIAKLPIYLQAQINAQSKPMINYDRRAAPTPTVVREGDWHFPVLRWVARMVKRGLSDEDILSGSESYTLPGWSVDQTRREVSMMIAGARRKGFDRGCYEKT